MNLKQGVLGEWVHTACKSFSSSHKASNFEGEGIESIILIPGTQLVLYLTVLERNDGHSVTFKPIRAEGPSALSLQSALWYANDEVIRQAKAKNEI